MDLKKYKEEALKTAGSYDSKFDALTNAVLGIAGEAGEVADILKKAMFQGHELSKQKLIDESGDLLWYINLLAYSLDISIEDMLEYNIKKLQERYPEGHFSKERSVNRIR